MPPKQEPIKVNADGTVQLSDDVKAEIEKASHQGVASLAGNVKPPQQEPIKVNADGSATFSPEVLKVLDDAQKTGVASLAGMVPLSKDQVDAAKSGKK